MALIFTDGFDHYLTPSMKGWLSTPNPPTVDNSAPTSPRVAGTGQHAMNFTTTSGIDEVRPFTWRKLLPSTYATIIVGFAINRGSYAASTDSFQFLSAASGVIASLRFDVSDRIIIANSAGTTIATGTLQVPIGVWHYLEFKLFVNGASGTVEAHRNGVVDIASTTVNIGSTNFGMIGVNVTLTGFPNTRSVSFDDLYVVDTSGSAPRNTFLGDVLVETLYPSADGANSGWSPNSGSVHFSRVNEKTGTYPDGDTTYNGASVAGTKDTYAFTDLTPAAATIFGVSIDSYLRKDDAAARTVCPVVRQAGVDYDGTAVSPSTGYAMFQQVYEQDPTAADWTVSVVNAAEIGAKVVT